MERVRNDEHMREKMLSLGDKDKISQQQKNRQIPRQPCKIPSKIIISQHAVNFNLHRNDLSAFFDFALYLYDQATRSRNRSIPWPSGEA